MDGRVGLKNGKSKWITNKDSRSLVHSFRACFDAIVIGGNTLRKDDPLLTSRGIRKPEPLRVVFTKTLDLPVKSNLWDCTSAKTLVVYDASTADKKFLKRIPECVEIEELSSDNPLLLSNLLANKGCNNVLWECGPVLATAAIKAGCIQELITFIGPKILGGESCMSPLSDFQFKDMREVFNLKEPEINFIGNDIFVKSAI